MVQVAEPGRAHALPRESAGADRPLLLHGQRRQHAIDQPPVARRAERPDLHRGPGDCTPARRDPVGGRRPDDGRLDRQLGLEHRQVRLQPRRRTVPALSHRSHRLQPGEESSPVGDGALQPLRVQPRHPQWPRATLPGLRKRRRPVFASIHVAGQPAVDVRQQSRQRGAVRLRGRDDAVLHQRYAVAVRVLGAGLPGACTTWASTCGSAAAATTSRRRPIRPRRARATYPIPSTRTHSTG